MKSKMPGITAFINFLRRHCTADTLRGLELTRPLIITWGNGMARVEPGLLYSFACLLACTAGI
jgi:hypothetical protein